GSDAVAADDQCHRNESGPGGGLAPEEGQRRHKASPGTLCATGARSLSKLGHDLCPSELTNRVYFPFTVLHKKWQYHLFTMLKQRVGTRAIKAKIDALWRKYPRGLVAYLEEGKVPAGGEGLAYYLAKYVVSPPISLRRILRYDGQRVRYWYNDHKTKQRQE